MNDFDKIAQEYVESLGEVLPGFKFGYANKQEFFFKMYYDFIFVDMDGNIPSDPPVAGGAAGFAIDKKTKEVGMLSFGDLGLLVSKQKELEDIYEKVKDIAENSNSLAWLKFRYSLNSAQLLALKRKMSSTKFSKESILEELDKLSQNHL